MTEIFETSRTLYLADPHSYDLVTLNTGASFRSWLSKSFGDQVFVKGQTVTVTDGSNDKKGDLLVSGKIISIRDHSIWVQDLDTNAYITCYPHKDTIAPITP